MFQLKCKNIILFRCWGCHGAYCYCSRKRALKGDTSLYYRLKGTVYVISSEPGRASGQFTMVSFKPYSEQNVKDIPCFPAEN